MTFRTTSVFQKSPTVTPPGPMISSVAEAPQRRGTELWQWLGVGLIVLATALNFLDRQLLAAVAPALKQEYQLSSAQYGQIIAAFSLFYALATPAAGLFIDRIGLRFGIAIPALLWSLAGALTGWTTTLPGLLACRIGLGISEATAIPSASKASATFLEPRAYGLGNALQSIGIAAGSIGAPLLAAALAPAYGWRAVFVLCGGLGLIWAVLWIFLSRHIPARRESAIPTPRSLQVLGDYRLWSLAIANALVMTLYSLWTNWTTIFFVQEYGLTQAVANRSFAWIPPIAATLGGLSGGGLAFLLINRKMNALAARLRVCSFVAPLLLASALIPLMRSPRLALVAISLGLLGCMAIAINIGVMPIDLFHPGRAGLSAAVLTSSFALMQAFLSPAIGTMVDHFGFKLVCALMAPLPVIGLLVLRTTIKLPSETQ